MVCILTVRKLKPGSYDDFRKAWEADEWPPSMVKAWILRNQQDPDEVVGIGFYEESDDVDPMRKDPARLASDERRAARMAPFVESVRLSGVFQVVEEFHPERENGSRPAGRFTPPDR
jgi:hypothetical protein